MKPKILVVDDEWEIRSLLKTALEIEDFEVWESVDGEEALDLIEKKTPDLVLLDINLPKIDGYQVCSTMRKMGFVNPIIMLTCQAQIHQRVIGLESGADDYVPKPFALDELIARIRAQLRRSNVSKIQAEGLLKSKWDEINEGLKLAEMLQQPFHQSPRLKNLEVAVQYFPVGKIGGDFYNLVHLDEDHMAILIGDALGKGLTASLLMAFAFSVLNRLIEKGYPPKEIMTRANQILVADLKGMDTFITAFCLIFDRKKSTITFSSAGHLPPILMKRNSLRHKYLWAEGLFLGAFPEGAYQEIELPVEPEHRIFFYTDGINEFTNPQGERISMSRLYRSLMKKNHLPVKELSEYLMQQLKEYTQGNIIMRDDFTFLLLELK